MSRIDYCAGLLEGEGCFSLHKRKDRKNAINVAIHCEMTDEEPIKHLKDVLKIGTICYRENIRKDGKTRKPSWVWSVQKREDIQWVLELIKPLMVSQRRKDKIDELLLELNT